MKAFISAETASWFPGVTKSGDYTVTFESDSFFEILRTLVWVL